MLVLGLAAVFELTGCYAIWLWVREGRSAWCAIAGLAALAMFGYVLARAPTPLAGRTFAAYGGVYLTSAFGWYMLFERARPDRWDVTGVLLGVLGACIILYAPR
jgi:small multidrug resistance family-3 protein